MNLIAGRYAALTLCLSLFSVGTPAIAQSSVFTQQVTVHNPSCVWSVVPSPNGEFGGGLLFGVSANSPTDAWSVGFSPRSSAQVDTLTEHWNGRNWVVVPSFNPANSTQTIFFGVAAISANDVWAVGRYSPGGGGRRANSQPLAEHWNGVKWNQVAVPTPDLRFGALLLSVAAVKSNDVWAVGKTLTGRPVIEHWDGRKWSIVSSPIVNGLAQLDTIVAISANDIWAGGFSNNQTPQQNRNLTEHWNGRTWSIVPTPDVAGKSDSVNGMAAFSPTSVFAVGESFDMTQRTFATLAEQWNGTKWTIQPTPNSAGNSRFLGVAASTLSGAMAIGQFGPATMQKPFAAKWTGSTWQAVSIPPGPFSSSSLFNIATVPGSTSFWAVGGTLNSDQSAHQTLIEKCT